MRRRLAVSLALALVVLTACSDESPQRGATPRTTTTAPPTPTTEQPTSTVPATSSPATPAAPVELEVVDVVTGLETVWSMAFDRGGKLWYTQRGGRLEQLRGPGFMVPGVEERGEGGLMGLEIDSGGRFYLMLTTATDNRIIRMATPGARPDVLVEGLRKGAIHNGGRLQFSPDGKLYAGTGDAGDTSLPQRDDSLNGKIIEVDAERRRASIVSKGHRNPQGLCFDRAGRFLVTEHGPDRGDEINVITPGFNGGWPDRVGNGIRNYTPTIALAGCAVYEADAIPQWKGSMLFTTLKGGDLRRLTFARDGSVADEEVLYDGDYGRLRDVVVGPDGFVYVATSNRDSRGKPRAGDDRILRIAPKGAPRP